jgi:hypothetical protein
LCGAHALRVSPATSPEPGVDGARADEPQLLTAAQERTAKREKLMQRHEQTQLELMRLLDQTREDPSTNQFHYLNCFPVDEFPTNPYHLQVCPQAARRLPKAHVASSRRLSRTPTSMKIASSRYPPAGSPTLTTAKQSLLSWCV